MSRSLVEIAADDDLRAYGTPLQQNYATYGYSPNGRRTSVTDANGNRAELRYDGFDRQTRWVFPSPTTAGAVNEADYEAYTHDAAGNRTSLRKRDGTTIGYAYDNLNRMTVKNVPASASGAAGYSVHYGYDLRNAQLYARFGSATGQGITTAYDGFGRPTSTSNSMGGKARTLSYQYDAGGRRSRLTFPDGNYFTYDYAASGQLTAIRENGGTAVASFSYDGAARPSGQAFAGASASYGYDAISRLSSLGHDLGGTTSDQSLGFTYNPASQIVTRTASNDAYVSNTAYAVNRSYSVNGLNQYTAAGPATFLYDTNGNLRSEPAPAQAAGTTTYVYDAENRLVSASGGITLSYDPLGRLFQTSGGSAGTTRFLYDGDELVAEYDGAGNLLRRYVHGLGTDDPVLWYEGPALADRRSLFRNHQGSIVAVADSAGNPLATNAYDSWGIPNSANQGRFGYTGQIWLPELGMWHYKARIYSPTLGRFLQTDPIGYDDDVNLYAYVGNDPVNQTDPTGLSCTTGSRLGEAAQCRVVMGFEIPASNSKNGQAGTANGALRQRASNVHLASAQGEGMPMAPPPSDAPQRLAIAIRDALGRAIPGIESDGLDDIVRPLSYNFSQVTDTRGIRSPGWRRTRSSHSRSAWEHRIPGNRRYVLKMYMNDRHNRGLHTISIVRPTGTFEHYFGFLAYLMNEPVNFWNASAYCRQMRVQGC